MNQRKKVVVLGAGVTGLAAAYRLSQDKDYEVHVVERETTTGGMCRSFTEGDFILDHGPHKFYSLIDGVVDELCDVMGDDLLVRDKTQSLYMENKYFSFPLKMSEMMLKFPPQKSAGILLSYAAQIGKNMIQKGEAKTYEDFIVERFGRGLYKQIFEPMATKIYGDPEKLDKRLAEVRISSPGLVSVIKQLLFRSKIDGSISAPTFHYPKYGFGMIPSRFEEKGRNNGVQFHLGSSVKKIDIKNGRATSVVIENKSGENERIDCDHVIYTIPLSGLPHLIDEIPAQTKTNANVSYRNVIIYYYLIKSKPLLPSMWVFFPESKFRFGRLSEMARFSPHTVPEGHTALMVDFTCENSDPTWSMDENKLGDYLMDQMAPLKLFDKKSVIKRFSKRFTNFYPVYKVGYQNNLKQIRQLETQFNNLFFIGRLGDFNYNNSDQCLDMGYKAADHIRENGCVGDGWQETRNTHFENYRIVD